MGEFPKWLTLLYFGDNAIIVYEIKILFPFLKEGLPSLKTACAHCMLGTSPNLDIFGTKTTS